MRVLDVGCGPGSITLGLAAAVAPGPVAGVDVEPRQVAAARARAAARGVANVRFEVADTRRLPFPDGGFDAVFASTLLEHLPDPGGALRAFRRLLAAGGLLGVVDRDLGAWLVAPTTPLLDRYRAHYLRLREHNGASPYYARHQRRLLAEAGFARTEGGVRASVYGTRAATAQVARVQAVQLREPAFSAVALRNGWAGQADLDAMHDELLRWGDRDDGLWVYTLCTALAWTDPGS
jgi:SAM-dependent methyltransferase